MFYSLISYTVALPRASEGQSKRRNVQINSDASPGMTLHVLIVALSRRFGGVDVRVIQTSRELSRRGVPHGIAVLQGSELHQRLVQAGLPALPLSRKRADPRIVGDLARLARKLGANVIDAHNMQSQYAAALCARLARIPGRVATIHSLYDRESPEPWRIRLREGALRLCRTSGFSFIAVSSEVRGYLSHRFALPPDRLTLSWNGIEPLPAPPAPIDLAAETGWTGDILVLGMISRLEPVKGHAFLLTAMRDLVRNGETRLRLFIAGEGRQEAALRQMVKDHDLGAYVHFAGFRSDISAILGAIDLFCLPSLTEGLPFAVLEACRQGVPVLASRLPSAADLFTDDQTIFFTPIGDAEALRQRLAIILAERSSLRRVGDAGRSLIERDLLIGPMVETTLGVYRAAISKACPT